MDVGDIINQYLDEARIDTDLDRLEVTSTQEQLVSNKHKWSARLINHKINLNDLNGIKFSYNSKNEIIVSYERKKHKIDEIINKIKNSGMEIYDISTDEGNLEDVFIDLTKN